MSWRARYRDPDTGRTVRVTLPASLSTEEARTQWAVTESAALAKRAEALAGGAPTKKRVTLEAAVARYFESSPELRPGTIKVYRAATNLMLTWAEERGLELTDDLRAEHLADLRAALVKKPWRGREGDLRAPDTVNIDLRALTTILDRLRRLGLVPMLSRDAISDALEKLPTPRPTPEHLKPDEIVRVIEATAAHDRDTFALTREEKARGLTRGETPRHPTILPYLATVLLSGMRADEARSLRCAAVDIKAPGAITLRPEDTKTHHGRVVDLIVSPLLRETLEALCSAERESVFALTEDVLTSARRRLIKFYGAPAFTWQRLRVTCGTFLANAPGIFGAASAYREARQLGHSVVVAEKHYLGVVRVDPRARTLEAAMGAERALRNGLAFEKKR